MISLILSAILSVEIVVIIDFCLVLFGYHYKLRLYALTLFILPMLLYQAGWVNGMVGVLLVCIPPAICFLMYILWVPFYLRSKPFENVDTGKNELYGGKRIMVIVPHQDDEINILGGVLEEYLRYGSNITLVYPITNGRMLGFRYNEALALCKHIGIAEENVIFLGYAFFNMKGFASGTTMGTVSHPAYHEGQNYSRENIVGDLIQIIIDKKPEIIFASDYDYHAAHHLVSICTDQAVGQVLRLDSAYRPKYVKCYAYRTCWESYPDYYSGYNIRSTLYRQAPVETYKWEERLRFPVAYNYLCRSLLKSEIYHQYAFFSRMGAVMRAINVNTDKVGWERRTDSVLHDAVITTTSGDGSKLKDFLLYDKENMAALDELPLSGAWIPDADDSVMEAAFTLPYPKDILYIDIYNNPSDDERIDAVNLLFEDGSLFDVKMEKDFVLTRVFVNKQEVNNFTLKITGKHGKNAGITEVEAFESFISASFSLIKIMNGKQHFVYDYWINKNGYETFFLFAQGQAKPLSPDSYQINTDNAKCEANISSKGITVNCPKGEALHLNIKSIDGKFEDAVSISNPALWKRCIMMTGKYIEAIYYDFFKGDHHRKATTLSIVYYLRSISKSTFIKISHLNDFERSVSQMSDSAA